MNISDILARIDAHRIPLGLSDSQLSETAGSRDLIRNWRRAVASGKTASARHDKLAQIAAAMGITLTDLLGRTGAPQPTANGFSEAATPFMPTDHPVDANAPMPSITALFGASITSPATFRLHHDIPAFFLSKGDVLIADMSRLPIAGEIAIVTLFDDDNATASHHILRYLPPFLLAGDSPTTAQMLRVDNPNVTVRYPVVASVRGIAPD